jgi:phosphoribosylformylglycinamidine cyclo-ligase
MGRLDLDKAKDILKGIAAGCLEAGCSLIGGETAEMPGMYAQGEYDLAGFVVGLADNSELLEGSEIAVGHQLVGIASSGLHSNGFSLVRKICFEELKMSVNDFVPEFGRTLGEELLEPTRIYVKAISSLRRDFKIFGISHITGGGFTDNIPRILPSRCKAVINRAGWTPPPVFKFLKEAGRISDDEMMRTFNNGLGLIIVVRGEDVSDVILRLNAMDLNAYHVGEIKERPEEAPAVEFAGL